MPDPQKTPIPLRDPDVVLYIFIMVFCILGTGFACYKLIRQSKVRIDCARENVNLLDRDRCMKERK